MCIAIATKAGSRVSNAALFAGWNVNRHGAGFAYVRDGEVVVQKGYMSYNDFQRAYDEKWKELGEDSPFLIHMRISTSGGITPQNTHPFKLESGAAMIHNGIMFTPAGERVGVGAEAKSDTRIFCEELGHLLNLQDVLERRDMIESAIGYGNKLAFLYPDKTIAIVGEKKGYWENGIWYSNGSCKVYESTPRRPVGPVHSTTPTGDQKALPLLTAPSTKDV